MQLCTADAWPQGLQVLRVILCWLGSSTCVCLLPEPRLPMLCHQDEKTTDCLQESRVLLALFKSDSKPDTLVLTGENNICPAYLQRLLEGSSEPFYQVQSDLQIQGFIIIKNTFHLPLELLDKGMLGMIKSWNQRGETLKNLITIYHTNATKRVITWLSNDGSLCFKSFSSIGIYPLCRLAYFCLWVTIKPLGPNWHVINVGSANCVAFFVQEAVALNFLP